MLCLKDIEVDLLNSGLIREINGLKSNLRKAKALNNVGKITELEERINVAKLLRKKLK